MAGTQVLLHLQVRRFFCRQVACPQRIFAERFPTLVSVYGRHSVGVCAALRHVGIAVGGRAGVRLAHALGLPWSSRTILRLVPDAPFPPERQRSRLREQPLVAPCTPYLRRRWHAGCRNANTALRLPAAGEFWC
jgi:hypothetical protein